jgi:hypothetical protein
VFLIVWGKGRQLLDFEMGTVTFGFVVMPPLVDLINL